MPVIIFVLGMIVGSYWVFESFNDEINSGSFVQDRIKECQSTLPRDVECVIIAVDEREIDKTEE